MTSNSGASWERGRRQTYRAGRRSDIRVALRGGRARRALAGELDPALLAERALAHEQQREERA